MKISKYVVFLTFFSVIFSCSDNEEEHYVKHFDYSTLEDSIPDSVRYHVNPSYPVRLDSLRILAIGNSFTDDAMQYMNRMVNDAGIDNDLLTICSLTEGSSTFKTWVSKDFESTVVQFRTDAGNAVMKTKGTIHEILNQNWDLIVIQQSSDQSYKWESFSYLKNLEDKLLACCPNKSVCLGFQLVWSHSKEEMPHVLEGNIACCEKMIQRYGADVVIPTGVAIQNARNTSLNDSKYLTRDDWHLNKGIARYIATATWFERLIRPVFDVSVIDNACMPEGVYSEVDVMIARQCAIKAIANPFVFEYRDK